jgi:hypothetical protein
MSLLLKHAAQTALDIQDACNLSGLVYSFSSCMDDICEASRVHGHGTSWKNKHPIVTLFLLKMAELNGCGSTLHESYKTAEEACRKLAGVDKAGVDKERADREKEEEERADREKEQEWNLLMEEERADREKEEEERA